ncbi:MAG: CAP domain-containing protein [Myxococcales bacterium]|nr:CAP domain-containing protein [Myxococcales bacterium]MCB9643123.1 CAP domain-containing protein [Myxococcales bacterium]
MQNNRTLRQIRQTLFSVTWVLWTCCLVSVVEARPFHFDYFHMPSPQKAQNKQEQALLQRISTWYTKQPIDMPLPETGIHEAAALLASYLAQAPSRQLSQERVQAAMWLNGRSDLQVQIFAMSFTKEVLLWKQLKQALREGLAGQRFNRLGLAIRKKQQKVCVIVFVRRAIELAPVLRWVPLGQSLTLRGRLLKGFQASDMILGYPDGSTQTIYPKRVGKILSAKWTPKKTGAYQLQVLGRDHRGAWISSQWHLYVYRPPQDPETLWRLHWRKQLQILWGNTKAKKHASSPAQLNNTNAAERLWRLLNAVRDHQGLILFRRHHRLDKFAHAHAVDMVKEGYFGHRSPQKGSFADRFKRLGWPTRQARENIVVANTPEEALKLWIESPVHRKNLLHPDFIWTGIGAYKAPSGRFYFVQVFVSAR